MSDFSNSTSETDIETAVDNSTTGSTVASNLNAKVSNAGVDWSSKTHEVILFRGGTTTVSGSGYLMSLFTEAIGGQIELDIIIDGTTVLSSSSFSVIRVSDRSGAYQISPTLRFESSLGIEDTSNSGGVGFIYALD